MKDKLGIKVSCANCGYFHKCLNIKICNKFDRFYPSYEVLMKRIIELQKQQFTKKELEALKGSIEIAKNEYDEFNWEETIFNKILKRIERILNER